jgi:hypothetical protein
MFKGADRTSDGHDAVAIPPAVNAPVRSSARRENFAVKSFLYFMEVSPADLIVAGIDKFASLRTLTHVAVQVTCLKGKAARSPRDLAI